MKKLKTFVRRISFGLLLFATLIICILGLISANVKGDLLNHSLPTKNEVVDSTTIHFIHGSIPEKGCSYDKKRLGGYLGGHIEIEINGEVFGFLYDSLPINYIAKNSFNSNFEVRGKKEWDLLTENDKITSIHIPISQQQKEYLYRLLSQYVKREPYDYAFLGQRCASSTAEILSDAGILNNFSKLESIIAFFYPRTLRHTILQFAKRNDLKIELKKGIECHRWE
jgi:hypothetical protein